MYLSRMRIVERWLDWMIKGSLSQDETPAGSKKGGGCCMLKTNKAIVSVSLDE